MLYEQSNVVIRTVKADFKIYDRYLTLRFMNGSTKGTDVFPEFQAALQEAYLDPSKMSLTFAGATNGCFSMLGANQGLN